ncbi:microtubule-associated protein 1A-like, partial [Scleropages formosus]
GCVLGQMSKIRLMRVSSVSINEGGDWSSELSMWILSECCDMDKIWMKKDKRHGRGDRQEKQMCEHSPKGESEKCNPEDRQGVMANQEVEYEERGEEQGEEQLLGARVWSLICDTSVHKLLVVRHLLASASPQQRAQLTLFWQGEGNWGGLGQQNPLIQDLLEYRLNPEPVLQDMEGVTEFTEYISETVDVPSPFDLLEPPTSGGFLKLSKPCCYIFPGGRGDSALFAVNGFNILNLISPELGVVFFNVPEKLRMPESTLKVKRSIEEASLTLQYLNKLGIKPEPLFRVVSNIVEPITLFHKMGVGRLDMYILNPVKDSKEMQFLMQKWAGNSKAKTGIVLPNGKEAEISVPYLTSVTALVVWLPASPTEKIVRVLFPGNAPQNKIFEGLEKLKHLDFLRYPVATQKDMSSGTPLPVIKQTKIKQRTDSKESLKSSPKTHITKGTKREPEDDVSVAETKSDSIKENKFEKKEKKIKETDRTTKPLKASDPAKLEKKKLLKEKSVKKQTKERMSKMDEKKDKEKKEIKKERREVKRDDITKKDEKKDIKVKEDKKKDAAKSDLRKITKPDLKPFSPEVRKTLNKAKVHTKPKTEKTKDKKMVREQAIQPALPVGSTTEDTPSTTEMPVVVESRSTVSSPEDLTKDFQELKKEDISKPETELLHDNPTLPEQLVNNAVVPSPSMEGDKKLVIMSVTKTDTNLPSLEPADEGIIITHVDPESPCQAKQILKQDEAGLQSEGEEKFQSENEVIKKEEQKTEKGMKEIEKNKMEPEQDTKPGFEIDQKTGSEIKEVERVNQKFAEQKKEEKHMSQVEKTELFKKSEPEDKGEEEGDLIEKAEAEEAEGLNLVGENEMKGKIEDTKEKFNKQFDSKSKEPHYPVKEEDGGVYQSNICGATAAAENVSYIQDETIPGYSETEQTISDEETEDRITHLRYEVSTYDISVPDEPGSFDSIHGMREMKAAAVPEAIDLTAKKAIEGPDPALVVYSTNIVAAPLAEEEHISSATSITECDKLSSFATSVAEDQSIASVTAPQTETETETGKSSSSLLDTVNSIPSSTHTEATQGKEYLHSAGTISPTSSLEEDKCFKTSPTEESQPIVPETVSGRKIIQMQDEEEEEEEEDEDQTPNADIPLSKLHEGYASPSVLHDAGKDFDKSQLSVSDKNGSTLTKRLPSPPSYSASLMAESSIFPDNEDRCLSLEDSTMKMASPTQSGPVSPGHTPFHQSPVEDKTEVSPEQAQKKAETESQKIAPTEDERKDDLCEQVHLVDVDKFMAFEKDTVLTSIAQKQETGVVLGIKEEAQEKQEIKFDVSDELTQSKDVSQAETDHKTDSQIQDIVRERVKFEETDDEEEEDCNGKEVRLCSKTKFIEEKENHEQGQKEESEQEIRQDTPYSISHYEKEEALHRGDITLVTGEDYEDDDEEEDDDDNGGDEEGTGEEEDASDSDLEKGAKETSEKESKNSKDTLHSSQSRGKDDFHSPDHLTKECEGKYYRSDKETDKDFLLEKEKSAESEKPVDVDPLGFTYTTTFATAYSSSSSYTYSSSTPASLSTSRQFGEEPDTPAVVSDSFYKLDPDSAGLEYSSFKEEHSLVIDSPFSTTANGPTEVNLSPPGAPCATEQNSGAELSSLGEVGRSVGRGKEEEQSRPFGHEGQKLQEASEIASSLPYKEEDNAEHEESECPTRPLSLGSTDTAFHSSFYTERLRKSDDSDLPPDVSVGASSCNYSTSPEYKQLKGEISPSFINPSPHQLSSDEEEDQRGSHSQEDDNHKSSKRNSHRQESYHISSQLGDGSGSHHFPGTMAAGLGLAGEETPPTSVSESLPSQSDSDVPPETEECPSITAEGNLDSDEDTEHLPVDKSSSSSGGGNHHSPSPRLSQGFHDPPPAPLKDPFPHPPHPDVCMVDPEILSSDHNRGDKLLRKDLKTNKGVRKSLGKPKSASPVRKTETRVKKMFTSIKPASKDSLPHTSSIKKQQSEKLSKPSRSYDNQGSRGEDRDEVSRSSQNPGRGLVNGVKNSAGSNFQKLGSGVPPGPPIYVDLAYIPNHCSSKNLDQEFFKRVRAAYYVVSGNDAANGEPSRRVLDALLEGKAQWGSNLQVTLIPTHDTEVTREWYQQTHERQQDLNIMVLASSSTV